MRTDLPQGVRIHIPGLGDQQCLAVSQQLVHRIGRDIGQDGLTPGVGHRGHDQVHRRAAELGTLDGLCQRGHVRLHHGGVVQGE